MKRFLSFLFALGLFVTSSASGTFAAEIAGTKCSKSGLTKTVSGKKYTCIKLGKSLYWNNGVKVNVSPTKSPTQPSLVFFQTHRNGESEELLQVTISPDGVLRNKLKLTSGPKFGLTVADMRNNRILLEVGSVKTQLYVLELGGNSIPLGIEKSGGIPTDSRALNDMRLSLDGKSIFAFDFDMDFYRIDISTSVPTWTRLFTGAQLKNLIKILGGDPEYDWVEGFELTGTKEIFLLTKNSFKGTLRFWTVITSLISTDNPRVAKIGEYQSSNELGDDSVDMAISPSNSEIAITHTVSTLTPKTKLLLYNIRTKSFRDFPVSQLFEGNNYFLSWLGDSRLIMTTGMVWTNDKDGGRVTCLLDLTSTNKCTNLVGVSGYSLVGNR
jgi:hypothetical protein